MSDTIDLPSYKEQSEAVRQRFAEIKKRPINMPAMSVFPYARKRLARR